MPRSRVALLRNPGFLRLWLAGWLSMLGTQASSIAVFLYLFRTGNSVLDLATIAALRTLPSGIVAPLAGVVVDRVSKKAVMVAADLSRMVLLVALILYPHVLFLYAITALCSLSDAFFEPARSASIPAVAGRDDIPIANGLDQMMWNVVMVGGPALGAILFTRWGLTTALALDAASFLVSAVLVSGIRVSLVESVSRTTSSTWSGVLEGWTYLHSSPATGRIAMLWFLSTLAIGVWVPLAPFFVRDALHGPDEAVGYQIAAIGCGGTLGGLAGAWACRRFRPGLLLTVAMLLEGFHLVLFSGARTVWVSIMIMLPWGFVVGIIFVTAQSMLQAWTPARLLGRVLSTVRQAENIASVGAMAAAVALGHLFPARTIFRMAGFFYIGAISLAAVTGRGRELILAPRISDDLESREAEENVHAAAL